MARNNFICDVIEALGNHKGLTEQQKMDFAESLQEELHYAFYTGKDEEDYINRYKNIEKSAKKAEVALKDFWKAVVAARMESKSITKLVPFLGCNITEDCDIKKVIDYFERYNAALKTQAIPKISKGPKRPIADQVANTISMLYIRMFRTISTGNGAIVHSRKNDDKNIITPYDRVASSNLKCNG